MNDHDPLCDYPSQIMPTDVCPTCRLIRKVRKETADRVRRQRYTEIRGWNEYREHRAYTAGWRDALKDSQ